MLIVFRLVSISLLILPLVTSAQSSDEAFQKAKAAFEKGEFQQSTSFFKRAIALSKREFPEGEPQTLMANMLASAYMGLHKYDSAILYLNEYIPLVKKIPNGRHLLSLNGGTSKVFVNTDGTKIAVVNNEEFAIYSIGEVAKESVKIFSVNMRGNIVSPFDSFFSGPNSAVFKDSKSILFGHSQNALLLKDTTSLPAPTDSASFFSNRSIREVAGDSMTYFLNEHQRYFSEVDHDNTDGNMLRTFYYRMNKNPKVKYHVAIGEDLPGGNIIDAREDNKFVLTTSFTLRPTFILWSSTGQKLLKWEMTDELNWMVADSAGHFDCTNKALKEIYFVSGLAIANQEDSMKKLYQPGLINKVLSRK